MKSWTATATRDPLPIRIAALARADAKRLLEVMTLAEALDWAKGEQQRVSYFASIGVAYVVPPMGSTPESVDYLHGLTHELLIHTEA